MNKAGRLLQKRILAALISGGLLLLPSCGYTLPSGGAVVNGSGSITSGGGTMDITGSGNVAINWDSFNIAQNETVNFKNMQAVLNYVSGSGKSEIFGKLNGSGVNVFLINPNGILFGKTAQVNVGQLTASTRKLDANALKDFNGSLAGLNATEAADVRGDIINLGRLTAGRLVLEGSNLSIIGADSLKVADKKNITLRANENINIGYEVTAKTKIDVGDGQGNTHAVSDYKDGSGSKASDVLSGATVTDLTGGGKSINDAMLVHDVYELQAIDRNIGTVNGNNYVVGSYMLAGDIDASDTQSWNSGKGFEPIGNFDQNSKPNGSGFAGVFDGLGSSIKDLYMDRNSDYYNEYKGLFDCIAKGAVVGNLVLKGGTIKGKSSIGSIAGISWGTIYNVVNSATVESKGGGGGIVGINGGIIYDTINNGALNINGASGGIAGANGLQFWGNSTGTLVNVKNTGNITSDSSSVIGGIVGSNYNGSVIRGAENTGSVMIKGENGGSHMGGIAARNYGRIEDVKNSGSVSGYLYAGSAMGTSSIGGIVGENFAAGSIKNAENTGAVSGDNKIGGIAGQNSGILENVVNLEGGIVTAKNFTLGGIAGNNNKGTIKNALNKAVVKSEKCQNVGGIAGLNSGSIEDAVNEGNVTGEAFVGGISGANKAGSIKNAGNIGEVKANKAQDGFGLAGGIAGYNYNGGIITASYNQGSVSGIGICVGGIVGLSNGGRIDNSYNSGSITGVQYVGGIVGSNGSGNITVNVYNLGTVSGSDAVGAIVGDPDIDGSITNAYYKTDTGYKKYDDNTEYSSVKDFNQAFLDGMQEGDKALWLSYGDKTTPLLRGLLQSLNIDVGDIEVEYSGSAYEGLVQAVADKLAEQGIIIDTDKLLAEGKTEVGEYALSDLLYSLQDGYDITASGKLIIKEKAAPPEPSYDAGSDGKYSAAVAKLHAEKAYQEEHRVMDKRRKNMFVQTAVVIEDEGIKLEEE